MIIGTRNLSTKAYASNLFIPLPYPAIGQCARHNDALLKWLRINANIQSRDITSNGPAMEDGRHRVSSKSSMMMKMIDTVPGRRVPDRSEALDQKPYQTNSPNPTI